MKYLVKRIIEPDYGCEERPADYIAIDTVILTDADGNDITVKVPDKELYAKDINVGDSVFVDEHNIIFKYRNEKV